MPTPPLPLFCELQRWILPLLLDGDRGTLPPPVVPLAGRPEDAAAAADCFPPTFSFSVAAVEVASIACDLFAPTASFGLFLINLFSTRRRPLFIDAPEGWSSVSAAELL